MYIIEVIPLAKLPPQAPQLLSYFFEQNVPAGALVEGHIGKRKVTGIVVSSKPLADEKISIKRASFQLRKLASVISDEPVVSPAQFNMAGWLSERYYVPLGICLKTVLPSFFDVNKYRRDAAPHKDTRPKDSKLKTTVIRVSAKDTLNQISDLIKPVLKTSGQVLMVVPEIVIAKFFAKALDSSDTKMVLLTSESSNAKIFEVWQAVAQNRARLIISTRLGLFLPFYDLKLVIVEDTSNEAYKSDMTPRFVATDVATMVAQNNGANIALLTSLPDANRIQADKDGLAVLDDRYRRHKTQITITDAVQEMRTGNFSMFSRKLQESLESAVKEQKSILFYSSRKAYSGIFFCRHCGATAKCQNCDIPLRLYKTPSDIRPGQETLLICYHCSNYKVAPRVCPNCSSNQLSAGGIAGSQKIRESFELLVERLGKKVPEEIRKKIQLFILDSDMTRTQKAEDELLSQIDKSSYPVIIATQKIFSHRYERKFDLIAIPNADGLTSGRDFRTDERFAQQFEKLLDFQPEELVIQTYTPDSPVFISAQSGNWTDYFEKELEARKSLGYPPFTRLVKLTFRHANRSKAEFSARVLSEKLRMVIHQQRLKEHVVVLGPSPASIAKENSLYFYNIILKISHELKHLDTILKYVPSDWMIDVDPKNLV